jgi:hypothetical protein
MDLLQIQIVLAILLNSNNINKRKSHKMKEIESRKKINNLKRRLNNLRANQRIVKKIHLIHHNHLKAMIKRKRKTKAEKEVIQEAKIEKRKK